MAKTDQKNYKFSTAGSKDTTVSYTTLSNNGNNTITVSEASKKISVYGSQNSYTDAIYVGFNVSFSIPAWKKYTISMPFKMGLYKYASGDNAFNTCELLYYGKQAPLEEDDVAYNAANGNNGGAVIFGLSYVSSGTGYAGSAATHGSDITGWRLTNYTHNTYSTDSKTIKAEYENRSDEAVTYVLGFGFFANDSSSSAGSTSLGTSSNPTYMQLETCTATVVDLTLEKPSDVSMTYTGTEYTTSNLDTIAGITGASWYDPNKMTLSLQEDSAKDVGTYSIDVSLKAAGDKDDPWKLSEGNFSHEPQT
ncbi:MAG: hypothetical protein K2O62_06475, partial [Clostridia bacterium]|nr:hypothetical protein [Clostridia bacterium]